MIARILPSLLVAGLVLCLWPAASLAHVNMTRADPPQDAVLSEPPESITLWFSGRIEADFASIEVTAADDGRRVDRDNPKTSDNRRMLEVGLEELEPGEYHVSWTVVARDGHRMRGEYSFAVE